MLTFGGELPFEPRLHLEFATGRFALRHLLQHLEQAKRLAVPDYLCEVVLQELDHAGVEAVPYPVHRDFSVSLHDDLLTQVDGVYVVHYFGFHTPLPSLPTHLTIIHDGVFFPDPSALLAPVPNVQFAFNSWRKILATHEGSQLVANVDLPPLAQSKQSNFALFKYRASELKTAYWRDTSKPQTADTEIEQQFLSLYGKGEQILNDEKGIVCPSQEFQSNLTSVVVAELGQIAERWHRWQSAKDQVTNLIPESRLGFPCFVVFECDHLQDLKQKLANQHIFLPHFWPNQTSATLQNTHERIGFLPLSPSFSPTLFTRALDLIRQHVS